MSTPTFVRAVPHLIKMVLTITPVRRVLRDHICRRITCRIVQNDSIHMFVTGIVDHQSDRRGDVAVVVVSTILLR